MNDMGSACFSGYGEVNVLDPFVRNEEAIAGACFDEDVALGASSKNIPRSVARSASLVMRGGELGDVEKRLRCLAWRRA